MLFGVLEEILGRFRPRRAAIQLEDLVSAVIDPAESTWFRQRGRDFRNDVAHGRFGLADDEASVTTLLAVVRQTIEAFIRFWVALDDASVPPGKAFLSHLEERVGQ